MKATIEQKELQQAVKAVNRCLNRRAHLPILTGINLQAKDGELILTTTDTMVGLRAHVKATVEEEGVVTVAGKNFVEAVGFFDKTETKLELQEKEILLVNGRDRVKVPIMEDEFPQFDESKNDAEIVKKEVSFWEAIGKNVAFAASNDQSRPALTGVLLKTTSEKTQIVCTDGFRLVVWETKEKMSAGEEETQVIVSAKAIADLVVIAGVLDEKKVGFYHNAASEQVLFVGEKFVFFSKLINANYPPFEKIVPLEFGTEVQLVREELIRNLTKASVFTKVDSNTVKLHLGEAQVDFTAASLGDGSFQGAQEIVKKTGAELEISFNIKYLLDFLNTRSGETIWMGCNAPTTPAMIKDPGQDDIFYIAMPFKPKN